MAARHNIPFIVVAPISTVDLDISDGLKYAYPHIFLYRLFTRHRRRIPIEHRPPLEACLVRGILYPNNGQTEQAQVMITPDGLEGSITLALM